jgi:flagellar biosynthetic protein FliR
MFADLVAHAQIFFLIAARTLAMVETAPLLSSDSVPQPAKVALAGFAAFAVYPWVREMGYPVPDQGLQYALLVVGEAAIGLIIGFFLTLCYAAFTMAGQLFSLQMGFSASEVFDPLAQEEIPLIGQFLNLVAMLVLLSTQGFRMYFVTGILGSFKALRAVDLVGMRQNLFEHLLSAGSGLFLNSLTLAMPILGTLFIVSLTTGLLSKAAPQMNLLTEGFPLSISVAFLLLVACLPAMMEAFSRMISAGFDGIGRLVAGVAP